MANKFMFVLFFICFLSSCGGDSHDGKAPFGTYTDNSVFSFGVKFSPDLPAATVVTEITGQVEKDGKSYDVHRIGLQDFEDSISSTITMNITSDKVELLTGEIPEAVQSLIPDMPYLGFELDEPVEGPIYPPVGEQVSLEVSGDFTINDPEIPDNHNNISVGLDYTVTDDDVTINSSVGVLHNVYKAEGTADFDGYSVNGEIYYHKDLGFIKGTVNYPPPNGTTIDLLSMTDMGDNDAEWNTIRKLQVLDGNTSVFNLDTYDCNKKFDADKDTHAKMLLELRWADEEMAKTETEPSYPGVLIDFGTVIGSYPSVLIKSPVSFFHPEENGSGYTYWYAYVDQAAKNEQENGIAYHIRVNVDTDITPALRVTGRIIYHRVQE